MRPRTIPAANDHGLTRGLSNSITPGGTSSLVASHDVHGSVIVGIPVVHGPQVSHELTELVPLKHPNVGIAPNGVLDE
jgi:hypothetical protein